MKEEIQQAKINRTKRQLKALEIDLKNAVPTDKPTIMAKIKETKKYLISLEADR